jgi:hypothetical protein
MLCNLYSDKNEEIRLGEATTLPPSLKMAFSNNFLSLGVIRFCVSRVDLNVALCDSSAYGNNFGTEYKFGKHLGSNTEHLAELKSVVRYRSGEIYPI